MTASRQIRVVVGESIAEIKWPHKPTARELDEISHFVLDETGGKASIALGHLIESNNIGSGVDSFAIIASSLGYDVDIELARGLKLKHRCGGVYTWTEWKRQHVTRLKDLDGTSFFEQRQCECGSHCSLGSMKIGRDL